jgi:hypothetical protein
MTQQLRTLAEQCKALLNTPWYDTKMLESLPIDYTQDSAYIAAVTPDVVLALLYRVDALTAERDALKVAAQAGLDALDNLVWAKGDVYSVAFHQLHDALGVK